MSDVRQARVGETCENADLGVSKYRRAAQHSARRWCGLLGGNMGKKIGEVGGNRG